MPANLKTYKECFLYLGHNASAVLYNSLNDFTIIEEEKLIRQNGGEYIPFATLIKLKNFTVKTYYIINFLGDINYEKFLLSYFRGDKTKIKTFLAGTLLKETKLNHHLSHLYYSLIFFLNNVKNNYSGSKDFHLLVNDGSGTDYESISLYRAGIHPGDSLEKIITGMKFIFREYAGNLSCGLLYARLLCNAETGFTILKDEYKSLGYETSFLSLAGNRRLLKINRIIGKVASSYIMDNPNFIKSAIKKDILGYLPGATKVTTDNVEPERDFQKTLVTISIDESLLTETAFTPFLKLRNQRYLLIRQASDEHFMHNYSLTYFQQTVKTSVPPPYFMQKWIGTLSLEDKRVVLSYIANTFLLAYYDLFLKKYKINNLIVSGGVHYNVKLNHFILKKIEGFLCVAPLSGDIVHAFGCASLQNRPLRKIKHLGVLTRFGKSPRHTSDGVIYAKTEQEYIGIVSDLVSLGHPVNILRAKGEIGPRALLYTSTISLPGQNQRQLINQLNARDDKMPMAPVLLKKNIAEFFEKTEYDRIIGSQEYMIIALTYKKNVDTERYGGVMHFDPFTGSYTGRLQLVSRSDYTNSKLLNSLEQKTGYKAFINTSFNRHGKSTVLSIRDAIDDLQFQQSNAGTGANPFLVIY
jgi:predicted NodU family carbamoyl transferase